MKKSVNIKDFVSSVNYQIGEGYEYRWDCYGDKACGLEWVRSDLAASASIVYDTKTQEVYEMSVWDCRESRPKIHRWIRPEYIKRHKKESKERGFKFDATVDNDKLVDTTPARILGHLKKLHKDEKKTK